jgi:hypothetical protein
VAEVGARQVGGGHREAPEVRGDAAILPAPPVPVIEPLAKERFVSGINHGESKSG